jgi:arsenite methyltransferase
MAPRFVAKQLSRPSGLGGAVIRFLMNRGNVRLNSLAVSQMALTPNDRVVEIGFGGGLALPDLISRTKFVCGIDLSEDVIAAALRRFSLEIDKALSTKR